MECTHTRYRFFDIVDGYNTNRTAKNTGNTSENNWHAQRHTRGTARCATLLCNRENVFDFEAGNDTSAKVQVSKSDCKTNYSNENALQLLHQFRSALLHANYRVSFSHACKQSLKTDAPSEVLWDILRNWEKLHPVKRDRFLNGTPLKAILEKEASVEHNLVDLHPDANPDSRKKSLARFPENPAAHWGPGTRSTLM